MHTPSPCLPPHVSTCLSISLSHTHILVAKAFAQKHGSGRAVVMAGSISHFGVWIDPVHLQKWQACSVQPLLGRCHGPLVSGHSMAVAMLLRAAVIIQP